MSPYAGLVYLAFGFGLAIGAWVGHFFGWKRGYTEWRQRYRPDLDTQENWLIPKGDIDGRN